MDIRTISVVALSNRDFSSFAAKLEEAERWIRYASIQGADLVVLPELLNFYRGDGPNNPKALPFRETALINWDGEIAFFSRVARKYHLAIVVPLLIREHDNLANVFFLISKAGNVLGRFQKLYPTPIELGEGVVPGQPCVIDWDGLPISGAICFDTHFYHAFSAAVDMGAKLFVIPSLWNGGAWLSGFAASLAVPIAVSYSQWSRIIDLDGSTLTAGGYRQESLRFGVGAPVFTTTLNFDREVFHLNNQADKIVRIQETYGRDVVVRMLHDQGAFCIESRSKNFTVNEIIADQGLVSFREYLKLSGDLAGITNGLGNDLPMI